MQRESLEGDFAGPERSERNGENQEDSDDRAEHVSFALMGRIFSKSKDRLNYPKLE